MRVRHAALASFLLFLIPAAAFGCAERAFEGDHFTVCTFDSHTEGLRLAWTGYDGTALQGFDRLAADMGPSASRVRFAVNAGMFEVGGMPLGLYVENGTQRRPLNQRNGGGNFYMMPNGVFSLTRDGAIRIDTTQAFLVRSDRPQWATQSGPMLVTAGALNPNITADGPSRNIRNGVGRRDTHTALFVISDTPVSFGKLARFFRDALACPDALYFDGAVSSLWVPSQGREDSAYPLGPMIVVMDKR